MMIRKLSLLGIFSALLFCVSTVNAKNIYRFNNEKGVPTLSYTLPPEAAQKGYEVIDDRSLLILKRVPPAPTQAEIEAQAKQAAAKSERQKQQELAREQQRAAELKQLHYDRTLLATYANEQELLDAKTKDIQFRQDRLELCKRKLATLKDKLTEYQQKAKQASSSGEKISENLQKSIDQTKMELINLQADDDRLHAEIKALAERYDSDLQRLKQLWNR